MAEGQDKPVEKASAQDKGKKVEGKFSEGVNLFG
jgi:hypothetical protein